VPSPRRRGARRSAEGRILVVDDSADMRAYLLGLLGAHWHVDLAADGPTALQRVHRTKPDVVLADAMMPGLDGLELVRRLRADPRTANVSILLLSARAGHEAAVEGLLAGADDYLAKPFSAPELIARIRSRLELLRARRRETALARAMLAITQAILAGEDVDRVLSHLARHASALLEADGADVARPSPDGSEVVVLATVGLARTLAAVRMPTRGSLHGAVLRSGRGRMVDDIGRSRAAHGPALRASRQLGPTLIVPLAADDRTIGVLGVVRRRGRPPFTNAEHRILQILAGQAALAIEHAERVALLERQRLARNLHDSVSQSIYGVALGARTALRRFETDPSRAVEPLEYVLELAESALAEMRTLIFELRPESLREHGLVVAIERQLDAARIRDHLSVEADLPAEPDLPLGLKEALYRVAQEALQNVVKHAQATRVHVRLAGRDPVELEVTDDGVGLGDAGDGEVPGHYGLRGMRERVQQRGGTLSISSGTGRGTTVRATVPG
jgi:signal transduction histidine kinase